MDLSKLIRSAFLDANKNKSVIGKTGQLFLFQVLVIFIGLGLKKMQTQTWGEEVYGLYAFFSAVTGFLMLFFRFGYFISLRTLLANNFNKIREKQLIGTGLVFFVVIGIVYACAIFALSFTLDKWFHLSAPMKGIFLLAAPFCFVIPFHHFITAVATGTGKVLLRAIYDVSIKLLFIIPLALFFFLDGFSIETAVLLNVIAQCIVVLLLVIYLKPNFSQLRKYLGILFLKNKQYGFKHYLGVISSQPTFKMDELFISYFVNTTQLGFYALAGMICSPMSNMSKAFATVLFKKYATLSRIPRKVFLYNTLWLVACLVGLMLLSKYIVLWLFGNAFMEVARYVVLLSFAYLFVGLYQPLNFLSVKSEGSSLRNANMLEAIINIAGNCALIPWIGVEGAILTTIIAKMAHCGALYYYYFRFLNKTASA